MKRALALMKTLWYVLSLRCEEAARHAMRDIGDALGEFDDSGEPTPMPEAMQQRLVARLREHDHT